MSLNASLILAGFEVGYRVRDEAIAFTIYALGAGMSHEEAEENIVLQKVLPRVQGSSPRIETALISLMKRLAVDSLSYPDDRIRAAGQNAGYDVITLAPKLLDYALQHNTYLHGFANTPKGTGHWNEEGHRVVAELLEERVCSRASSGWRAAGNGASH